MFQVVAGNAHNVTKSELPYPSREAATVALGRALQPAERRQQLDEEQEAEEEAGLRVTLQPLHPDLSVEDGGEYIATVELVDGERHNALSIATARALRRYADQVCSQISF